MTALARHHRPGSTFWLLADRLQHVLGCRHCRSRYVFGTAGELRVDPRPVSF